MVLANCRLICVNKFDKIGKNKASVAFSVAAVAYEYTGAYDVLFAYHK